MLFIKFKEINIDFNYYLVQLRQNFNSIYETLFKGSLFVMIVSNALEYSLNHKSN